MIKTLLTKDSGIIDVEIDSDLQINNSYSEYGIYLVKIENGVVWGYDANKYEYKDEKIVKKKIVKNKN